MNVFDLDKSLLKDYERFARSFTRIRAEDIKTQVDQLYSSNRFWPDPLITINPHYESGSNVSDLVSQGLLHADTAKIFQINNTPITLHRHQTQAASKAHAKKSFVVTTGTGSGKSLCFFVPIVDAAVRAKAAGEEQKTRAIIVYPMNALANSQLKEIEKFVEQSGLPDHLKPSFERYTGQETQEERERIMRSKPDILLTNFMMLELLMTRQSQLDNAVIQNAQDLDFIVLDELHTYRGRQGADVAMLVRRLKDRLCQNKTPICIGTSATMASEGDTAGTVAEVASKLFGTVIGTDSVIDESLQRATNPELTVNAIKNTLADAVNGAIPEKISDAELKNHPLAIWVELEIGLLDEQKLKRRQPITLDDAAKKLADLTSCPQEKCREQLEAMLIVMSLPESARGGHSDRAFMAFKLHQFISGAGHVYATIKKKGQRKITLDGQKFDPEAPESRLYSTFFCRNCGQEYHPVTLKNENGSEFFIPRDIDEIPLDEEETGDLAGYLMPEPENDPEFLFTGSPDDESFPEEWLEQKADGYRIKKDRRGYIPQHYNVEATGEPSASGIGSWFLPGKFRFCLCCKEQPAGQARERNKLAGLSAEGRSSATTLLVSSSLRWMNERKDIPEHKRKLLGFTDNRQDAALQAGHFNDFLFVSLLRAATLTAIKKAGPQGLGEDEFGAQIQKALGFTAENINRRREWMLDPEIKGVGIYDAERTLARVLAYRVWSDQRRGWRYTNPNLEQLGLIKASYLGIDDLSADMEILNDINSEGFSINSEQLKEIYGILLDTFRKGLAVTTDSLDRTNIDSISQKSRQLLRDPWSISQNETAKVSAYLMIQAPRRENTGLRGESIIIRGGSRSALGKQINKEAYWGRRLKGDEYTVLLEKLLRAAAEYQLVRRVSTPFDIDGWQLSANAIRLVHEETFPEENNQYFIDLYNSLSESLATGGDGIFGIEGREHTAQVDQERREWREWRFRWNDDDCQKIEENKDMMRQASEPTVFLPALFCSPTMELGVDISALNTVYMRNVPPTPANYAQRSGRAGRSGQAALVVTYCAAQGPHDQYYFSKPVAMVSGIVRPPALDLTNKDLVEAHLHAVWLADSKQDLANDIPHVLDLSEESLPVDKNLLQNLSAQDLNDRARISMKRILASISDELEKSSPAWAKDQDAFIESVANNAVQKFIDSFNRWRDLYKGARAQLKEANKKTEMHGLGAKERKEAKIQQAQANEQIMLLERGNSSGGADFYTYRYLATEGFLPGYNFPRLPLYAYVPAAGFGNSRASYLQRARFLAIAEFGPMSLIYHEGRAYRVVKAKLPPGIKTDDGGRIATSSVYICDDCGAAHDKEVETCFACGSNMSGIHPIRNVLRIDNVETKPAERITANEEDRQRQGYDIQTVFTWPNRDGVVDVSLSIAHDENGPVVRLDYASGTTISRINKGLKRRKEKSIMGFGIDPSTGWWKGGLEDAEEKETPEGVVTQRIVPIVQDNKNAALLRLPANPLSEASMATLQHALVRGLEIVFQLEEGETLAEPVPSNENRRAILFYEATEGGAGVLGRLLRQPDALASVAKTALELMHYTNIDAAIKAGDISLLKEEADIQCVKGCYKCLLSYYNQPDHEQIDRTDHDVLELLLRMARSQVKEEKNVASVLQSKKSDWNAAIKNWKFPAPDTEPLQIGDYTFPLVWRPFLTVAVTDQLAKKQKEQIEALGFTVVELPSAPGETPPDNLSKTLGVAA